MLRAIAEARRPEDRRLRPGIGLWYPTPSKYEALSFLASLSDSFVGEIERRFRSRSRVSRALWRRLLIRIAVGDQLIESSDEERLLQLRDVVIAATESAAVARIVLEERIRIETRVAA